MDGNQRWLGWLGIGLGVLALLIALTGRGFGPQMLMASGSSTMPQGYAQQRTGRQNNAVPQAGNTQQGSGRQNNAVPQGGNAQQGTGNTAGGRQRGQTGRGAEARQDGGRRGNQGFGSWFRLPFKLFGNLTRLGLLALLIVLGFWLIRGRRPSGTASASPVGQTQGPAPEQRFPTGETYTEELDTDEPRDQV
jgi:hypothetical protein